ncbi:hypothetical protein K438DRAFT_1850180, partial [Mycena galopus ATCC 62051]
ARMRHGSDCDGHEIGTLVACMRIRAHPCASMPTVRIRAHPCALGFCPVTTVI